MHTRNPGYRPGDYWMQCDVCGFDYRRSQMRKRWDGLWTCESDWEPRHPQDTLKAKADRIAVPVSRPDTTDTFDTTTLAADAAAGATSITVADASGIADGDSIGIVTNNEISVSTGDSDYTIHWTLVDGDPAGAVVTIKDSLDYAASSGKTVYIKGQSFLTSPVTASSL